MSMAPASLGIYLGKYTASHCVSTTDEAMGKKLDLNFCVPARNSECNCESPYL